MTIEKAIKNFQVTRCEDSFAKIYYYIYSKKNIVSSFARQYRLDEHDVESLINEKMLLVLEKYEDVADKFRNAVYRSVKRGCIDLVRKRNRHESHSTDVLVEDDDGNMNEIYEIIEVAPTTDDEITGIQKKRDQRQLITFLLSNANELTLTSASAFIETESYRKAAKQIGTTDKTVKSRIRNLSKRFDAKIHGSYYDYFTTPTIHVG